MANDQLSRMMRRWVYRVRPTGRPGPARRQNLRLEECEARLAPATLPVVSVTDTRVVTFPGVEAVTGPGLPDNYTFNNTDSLNGLSPSAAYNPADPNKIVLATTDGSGILVKSSADGGATWKTVLNTQRTGTGSAAGRMIDITSDPRFVDSNRVYTNAASPSVAFDRNGTVYVVHVQTTEAGGSSAGLGGSVGGGVIVLHKFSFAPGQSDATVLDLDPTNLWGTTTPATKNTGLLLHRFTGQDQALNVVVGVDNNVASATVGGNTFVDTLAAGKTDPVSGTTNVPVYVAWNTNTAAITTQINYTARQQVFNPAVVFAMGSVDGGLNFSSPLPVNDAPTSAGGAILNPGGFLARSTGQGYGAASPKIVFSQGNGVSGDGGRLTFVWNQLSGPGRGQIRTDSTQPDGGSAAAQAVTHLAVPGSTGLINAQQQRENVGASTLAAPLDANPATPSFQVVNAFPAFPNVPFPAGLFTVKIDNEIIGISGFDATNTFFIAPGQRGLGGTVIATHPGPVGTALGSRVEVASFLNSPAGITATQTIFTVDNANGFLGSGYQIVLTNPANGMTETLNVIARAGNTIQVAGPRTGMAFPVNTIVTVPAGQTPTPTGFGANVTIPANFGTVTNLEVKVSFQSPGLSNYSMSLVSPSGQSVRLFANRNLPGGGAQMAPTNGIAIGLGGGNFVGQLNGAGVAEGAGVTFSDFAARSINDPVNTLFPNQGTNPLLTSLIGTYRPDENFEFVTQSLRGLINSTLITNGTLDGTWQLVITEIGTRAMGPAPFLLDWSVNFTGAATPYFGTDSATSPTGSTGNQPVFRAMPAGIDNVNPLNQDIVPSLGIGPGVSVAYDTTLFAAPAVTGNVANQTARPGRLYMVFTGYDPATNLGNQETNPDNNNTDIFLIFSDNHGATWSAPIKVNDDTVTDGTEGNRTQFQPTVAVDPLTGTVVVTWYDTRNDADSASPRAATYIATSIDGGLTFGPQTFLNTPKQATNSVTNQAFTIEPIPTNLQRADDPNRGNSFTDPQRPHSVGTRQALLAYGGRVNAFWTGTYSPTASGGLNPFAAVPFLGTGNDIGASVYTATVTTATGPRVDGSDQGSVTTTGQFLETTGAAVAVPRFDAAGNVVSFTTYNDRFAGDPADPAIRTVVDAAGNPVANGTRLLDGFIVRFDRSIYFDPTGNDPQSFAGDDVVVQWQKAAVANTTLTQSLAATGLTATLRVASTAGFPTTGSFRILIDNEILTVTSFNAATNEVNVTRTVPAFHSAGATVRVVTVSDPVTTLAAGLGAITPSTTTIQVGSTAGFPTNGPFQILIGNELLTVTSFNAATNTATVVRGLQPAAHAAGSPIRVISFGQAVDLSTLGVRYRVFAVPSATFAANSVFFVQFVDAVTGRPKPQGGVGTYSYAVGPNIRDTVFNPITGALGSFMDQNADGVAGIAQPGDVYAVPTPVNGGAFTRPYTIDTRPLIIPGPYVEAQYVPVEGNPAAAAQTAAIDAVAIDTTQSSSLLLTLATAVLPTSFIIFDVTFQSESTFFAFGGFASFIPVPVDQNGNPVSPATPTRFYRITLTNILTPTGFLPQGRYGVVLQSNPVGGPVPVVSSVAIDTTRATGLLVTFDRSVAPDDFDSLDDIQTLNGPAGAVIVTTSGTFSTATSLSINAADIGRFPLSGNYRMVVEGQVGGQTVRETVTVLSRIGNVLTVSRSGTSAFTTVTVRLLPVFLPIDAAGNPTASPTRFFRLLPVLPTGALLPVGAYAGTADPTTPSADGLFLNTGGRSINVVFDREMDPTTVTDPSKTMVQLVGANGSDILVTTLSRSISPTDTVVRVVDASGFLLAGGFDLKINGEVMRVVSKTANTLTVIRGVNGTVAAAHNALATVSLTNPRFSVLPVGTGNTRTYQINFPALLTQNTPYNLVIIPVTGLNGQALGPISTAGDALDTNLNAGLDRLRGTSAAGANIVTDSYSATFAPGAQPITAASGATPGGRDVPLVVGDNFIVDQDLARFPNQTIQVSFDITFPTTQDLQIFLVAPNGVQQLLYRSFQANTGGSTANFVQTILDDKASTNISQGSAPFQGTFSPQLPLSLFADVGNGTGVQAQGTWLLRVVNGGSNTGTVTRFALTLPHQDTTNVTGLGEPVADRATIGMRVFFQDPTTLTSQNQWTAVNTATNNGASAGQATATVVDPSDRSGNTVFVGGAGGGVWKTTNFLTTDPKGPSWVPLTDGGPTFSLNVSSLAVAGRNNDSNQSIVFALTGEGNIGSPGVGLLRSMDGGRTWVVLDSQVNGNPATQTVFPITDRINRTGVSFYGATGFKVVVDPTPITPGNYVVFMAVQGTAAQAGLWRSLDTGLTWTRLRAGQASDIQYAPGSADPTTQLLQRLYVAFEGEGVYYTFNAPGRGDLTFMAGGDGNNLITDANFSPPPLVTVDAPVDTPNGAKGRIVLAVPGLQDSPLLNSFYQDWVYALVARPNGTMDGLYMTKDFGRNWTKLNLPNYNPTPPPGQAPAYLALPTNNETRPQVDLFGNTRTTDGTLVGIPILQSPSYYTIDEYAMGLAVDPLNPNIVYAAGIGAVGASTSGGSIRIDVSAVNDQQALVFYDYSRAGQGGALPQEAGNFGAAVGRPFAQNPNPQGFLYIPGGFTIYTNPDGTTTDFTNLSRDPLTPFVANASLRAGTTLRFTNTGENVKYVGFQEILTPAANSTTFGANFVKQIITFRDPLTGKTRLIYATENGLFSGVDNGDGTLVQTVGFDPAVNNNRNGNLQLQQFTSGAVQPSQLAADLAGTMFFATGRDNGFAVSSNDVLQTGDTAWTGQRGSGVGAAVDPSGSGTAYQYRQACCGADNTQSATPGDFFRVLLRGSDQAFGGGIGRTNGLVTGNDDPASGQGQWPQFDFTPDYSTRQGAGFSNFPVGFFAVNPVRGVTTPTNPDGTPRTPDQEPNGIGGIAIGSSVGRVYLTSTLGRTWFPIAEPGNLDGSVARSLAFGSPDPNATQAGFDLFLYAGTQGGNVFVTRTGGGANGWTRINIPNDGTPIMKIEANPRRGSRDAFVVTQRNIYYINDISTTNVPNYQVSASLVGNLFSLGKNIFGDQSAGDATGASQILNALQYLTTIAVDWRFATPVDPNNPTGATFPVVYAGGAGGVFRSTNVLAQGQTPNWEFYPNNRQILDRNDPNYDPTATGAVVNGGSLPDAVITDLDLATGAIDPTTGLAIQNSALNLLVATTYGRGQFAIRLNPQDLPIFSFQPGPRVVSLANTNPPNGPSSTVRVTFDDLIDPNTFSAGDVTITGPSGAAVTVLAVTPVTTGGANSTRVFDITFAAQTAPGAYTFRIGPNISDPGGNLMNQNLTFPNGEAGDAFVGQVILNSNVTSSLGLFDTRTNQSGLPAQVASGEAVPFEVRALRADGSVDPAARSVVVTVTGVGPNGLSFAGGAIIPTTLNPDGSRSATVPLSSGRVALSVTFTATGGQSVRVVSAANPADINPVTANTSVVAGLATRFEWSAPSASSVGVDMPVRLILTARDANGNVATAFNGGITLSSTDLQAIVGATGTTPLNGFTTSFAPGDAGQKEFIVRFQNVSATGFTVSAAPTTPGLMTATSQPIVVTPGPVSTVVATVDQPSVIPGGTVTVTVVLRDSRGNQVTNFNGTVTAAVANGSGVVQPPSQAMPTGTGTFLVTLNAVGSQSITVTATPNGGTAVTSPPVTVNVSLPVATASASPAAPTAGGTTQVTVRVVDAGGQVLTGYNGTVTLTSSDPAAGLPPTGQLVNGQLTLPVTLNSGGQQTVTATVNGPGGPLVFVLPITVNVPTAFASANPTSLQDGQATQVTVQVRDASGQPVTGYNGTVTLTSSDPQAVLPPTAQLVDGQAILSVTLNTVGNQTITATVNGPGGPFVTAPVTITVTRASRPTITPVIDQSAPADGTIGPIRFTVSDAETPVSGIRVRIESSDPSVIDPVRLTQDLQSQQSSATKSLLIVPLGKVGVTVLSIIATDGDGNSTTSQFTVTITAPLVPPTVPPAVPPVVPPVVPPTVPPTVPPVGPPPPPGVPAFAVATGPGTQSTVSVYAANGQKLSKDLAFGSGYSGGSRVALASGPDGFRLVTVAAPGRAPDMTVTNLSTGSVQSFLPFEASFTGGMFISAGDLNGDGVDDYVVSPDQGGGPRIQIRDGRTGAVLTNFFGIDDPNFRGGVRTAVGDVNGDGVPDVIVAAGFGGGPRVAIFDGRSVLSGAPTKLVNDFFVFEEALRNGAYVAAGDINGDGFAEVIAGAGPGGGPRVVSYDGAGLMAGRFTLVSDFLAGDVASRAGIPVTTARLDGDELADIVVGTGEGAGSRVTGYLGRVIAASPGSPTPTLSFDEEGGFKGGVFVG